MVISFNLGDNLKETLISLGVDKDEAKKVINEFEVSLESEIKREIKEEVATSLSDLPTRNEIKAKFEQVDKQFEQIDKQFERIDKRFEIVDKKFERIDDKLDKLLYILIGFMLSFIAGVALLVVRFGTF